MKPFFAPIPTLAALTLALAAAPALRAQDAAVSGKDYPLAHRSTFAATSSQRNPFWPIGWTPSAAPVKAAEVVLPPVKAEDFVVTTTSLDYPPLAVINGRTYGVGDQVPAPGSGAAEGGGGESVTVKQIMDGAVVLDYHGTKLKAVSGRNPGAAARKPGK